jgi:Zn-finger nucleic acid-binding protein
MECPVCNKALIVLELNEVEIDYCPSCEGIWLDSGELELLIEDESERKKIFETFFHEPEHPEKHYKCPICSKRMDKIFVGDGKEILIDRCSKGHGLWSDKGELYNIMKMTREGKVVNLLREIFNNKLPSN